MVDVMLVLLVIFMITAPLMTAGVPLDLPKTKAGQLKGDDKPVTVSVKADGSVWLQETPIQVEDLGSKLKAITATKPDTTIFVRGDAGANYGKIAEVLSNVSGAGFAKISLITQPAPDGAASRKGAR